MIGAPKTKNVCQSPGFATIIANTGTTIERLIKRPAMKLPACRNLAGGFFMTTLILIVMAAGAPYGAKCSGSLRFCNSR